MNNKEILDYQVRSYRDMLEWSHEEGRSEPVLPIVNFFRNDYEAPLISMILRPFDTETKAVTFATAMLVNAVLPIDKVGVTMDATVSKRENEEGKTIEEQLEVMPSQDPNSVDVIFSQVYERNGNVDISGIEYSIEDKTGDLVFNEDSDFYEQQGGEFGGMLSDIIEGSFNTPEEVLMKFSGNLDPKERSIEYFETLMTLLSGLGYLVMATHEGIEFLNSIGITDTQFEDYKKTEEE